MVGLIGKKIGMTQIFNDNGDVIPVSVVKIEKNIVVDKRTADKNGYSALVLGVEDLSDKKVNKSYKGIFGKDIMPKRYLKEFRCDDSSSVEVGHEFDLDVLSDIKFVDVTGISKGKGYQGVMKRYGFKGGPATHGSKFKRDHGSTGQNTYPGHCFKDVKRAGRMGREQITIQNLKVVKIDKENSVALLEGSLPGSNNSVVYIRKSCKKK
jgi:large subunit ribosomal protein L3